MLRSAGKKMELQQKEKTDEKEGNGVDKKGGVAHEVSLAVTKTEW